MITFGSDETGENYKTPLIGPLLEDLHKCELMIKDNNSQFAKRTFFRTCFAFLEAHTFLFKSVLAALVTRTENDQEIMLGKLMLLMSRIPKVDTVGKMEFEQNKISFANQLAFVIRTFSQEAKLDPAPIFGDNKWNDLRSSLKVRHRITHPKSTQDLDISDDELLALRRGLQWHFDAYKTVSDEMEKISTNKVV